MCTPWAAAAASAVCIVLFACQRLMTLEDMMGAWTTGFKDMMEPLLILMLAWALGAACLGDMGIELDRQIGGMLFFLFHLKINRLQFTMNLILLKRYAKQMLFIPIHGYQWGNAYHKHI